MVEQDTQQMLQVANVANVAGEAADGPLGNSIRTRLLVREAVLGIFHGVWLGLLVAVIAIVWQQNLGLALVLGLAMLGNWPCWAT